MSMVYFAQRGYIGPIKIGYTRGHVAKRLAALRSQIQHPLILLATMPGDREEERMLHERFAKYAIGHEWFSLCPAIIKFTERLHRQGLSMAVWPQATLYRAFGKSNIPAGRRKK